MLIYDASRQSWVYLDRTETVTSAMLQLLADRVTAVAEQNSDNIQAVFDTVRTMFSSYDSGVQNRISEIQKKHDSELGQLKDAYNAKIRELEDKLAALQKRVENYLVIMDIPSSEEPKE